MLLSGGAERWPGKRRCGHGATSPGSGLVRQARNCPRRDSTTTKRKVEDNSEVGERTVKRRVDSPEPMEVGTPTAARRRTSSTSINLMSTALSSTKLSEADTTAAQQLPPSPTSPPPVFVDKVSRNQRTGAQNFCS